MDWADYFMGFAEHAAEKSKDLSTQVGCAIFGPDDELRSTGFNGLPRGVKDIEERLERPAKYTWTSHAEENAVAHAARVGVSLKGCRVYVTHHPCSRCSRLLIQAGVESITVGHGKFSSTSYVEDFEISRIMLVEADVQLYALRIVDSDGNREEVDYGAYGTGQELNEEEYKE